MDSLMKKVASHPLIDTLLHVRGNARACLLTEPLWGIPYNLYAPFVSVYMAALGMEPLMIGVTTTVFIISQMIWAMLGGVITDKMGRRRATLLFDVLGWSVPALLWMLAQNVYWFIAAALFNGLYRVTETSWTLLFVEEAPESKLTHLYALANIMGLIAAFVAPIPYFFVKKYSVVPTMRFLYGLTFVMMTVKFVLLYFITHETNVGLRRQEACRHIGLKGYLLDSRHVLARMLKTPRVMYTLALLASLIAIRYVIDNFWPLLITSKLGIGKEYVSIFATLRSLAWLAGYFLFALKLNVRKFQKPLMTAFLCLAAVHGMLIFLSAGTFLLVGLGVLTEALSLSVIVPITSSLQMLSMDREDRARMNGLFLAMCLLITSPMGTLAGALSQLDRSLPFALTLLLCLAALFFTHKVRKIRQSEDAPSEN